MPCVCISKQPTKVMLTLTVISASCKRRSRCKTILYRGQATDQGFAEAQAILWRGLALVHNNGGQATRDLATSCISTSDNKPYLPLREVAAYFTRRSQRNISRPVPTVESRRRLAARPSSSAGDARPFYTADRTIRARMKAAHCPTDKKQEI